jgi:hypothetical protein
MEAYASTALAGLGYAFSQNQDPFSDVPNHVIQPGDVPSMDNVYQSTHWNKVRNDEFNLVSGKWADSQTPMNTGVVPRPAYADMFMPIYPEQGGAKVPPTNTGYVESLTGEVVSPQEFTHNNMQPFYRGSLKQSIDPFATSAYLENATGRGERFKHKQEVNCFFEPTPFMGNVCGMKDNTDFYLSHIQAPKQRNNDFPIEQVRVGKGLGQGFNATPEGGFQQSRTLEYARPRTVDELRPLSRPKSTYETPTQGPQGSKVQNRGLMGDFSKNRPDTYYEQSKDQWLVTTGANTKPSEIPEFVVKPTARVDGHVEYMGASKAAGQPGKGSEDDYGRSGVIVYSNAREETEQRTVLTNVAAIVKTVVAPFMDILKRSQKEYTVDAARTYGNMSAQIPEKPTLYDPVNHIMKTTIKETTIHDTTILNPRGQVDKGWAPTDDEARKTVRQTVENVDTVRNVGAHTYKTVVINPESIAKKTVRETTEDNNHLIGNVGGPVNNVSGAYSHIEVQVYNTQKQYISENPHVGQAGSGAQYYPRTVDAEYNMEVDGTREMMNIKSGYTPNAEGMSEHIGAENLDMEAKKLESDRVNPREEGNVTRIYQPTAMPVTACEVTKDPQKACMNENAGRLDPNLLASLKENPYNLSVNPI